MDYTNFQPQAEPGQAEKPSTWNIAAIEGLKLAGISIVFSLIAMLVSPDIEKQMQNPNLVQWVLGFVVSLLKLGATGTFLWYCMKKWSALNAQFEGSTSYGKVFKYGLIVSLLSGIVYAVFSFIHLTWISPETTQLLKDAYLNQWNQILGEENPVLETTINNLETISTIGQLFSCVFYGLIWSAILGIYTKRLPDPMQNINS